MNVVTPLGLTLARMVVPVIAAVTGPILTFAPPDFFGT